MTRSRFFHAPGSLATGPRPRVRRKRRIPLSCEILESRQLLSAGTASSIAATTSAQAFLQVVPMASPGFSTYTPQQIASAYGINSISLPTGSGTNTTPTIAIVDPYNDPKITADLAAFDAKYGLPAPPSFTVDNLGATTTDAGWAMETALDVEWAHAIDPQANIVLVEASDASLNSLLNAVSTAANLPGVNVVSMSWGTSEFYGEASYAGVFNTPPGHTNVTFIAASGDSGAWSGPSFPSVMPNVLAVGGTTLSLGANNAYGSETGWTGSTGGFSGLDNGFRSSIPAPSYQGSAQSASGLNYGLRTTPDVSFNADPNAGYAVYSSVPYNGSAGWFTVGGTSAAAPAWAGLVAITDQGLMAAGQSPLTTTQLLTDLYSLPSSDFQDVTSGFNGYSAGKGYDLVTGLGTPKANLIVAGLLNASGVKPSASTQSSATASNQASHAAVVRNAAVVTSVSTGSTSVVGTMAGSVTSNTTAITALPTQSPSSTSATASPGQVAQSGSTLGSSSAASTAPIGLGQGASPSVVSTLSGLTPSAETESATADVVEPVNGVDQEMPESPTPGGQAPESPTPQRPAGGEVDPQAVPEAVPPTSPAIPGVDAPVVRLVAQAPAVRVDPRDRREEEADATVREGDDPRSSAGLVLAGAVAALGHKIVTGRSPRRRPLTAAFRTSGR